MSLIFCQYDRIALVILTTIVIIILSLILILILRTPKPVNEIPVASRPCPAHLDPPGRADHQTCQAIRHVLRRTPQKALSDSSQFGGQRGECTHKLINIILRRSPKCASRTPAASSSASSSPSSSSPGRFFIAPGVMTAIMPSGLLELQQEP